MSAPDFYFAVNAMFRHIHDQYGKPVLIDYWRNLGREYYAHRVDIWRQGGAEAIATDWRECFSRTPQAEVDVRVLDGGIELDVHVCPAIKHLRDCERDIVPCFCEHCDYKSGAMAEAAGYEFERTGGMGSCRQRFVPLNVKAVRSG